MDEARLQTSGVQTNPTVLLEVLKDVFGERRSLSQLLAAFYERKQGEKESLREYLHALHQLAQSICSKKGGVFPDEKLVLRNQFIEGLGDTLFRELRKRVRENSSLSFLQIRARGFLLGRGGRSSFSVP